jgi:hypothetical protein
LDWDIDVLTEYSDEILKDKIKEIKKDIDEAKEYKEYEKCYKKFKKVNIDKLTDDECELLYKYDFEKFEDIPEPKYPNGFLLHWVIDDMIGSNIFKHGKSAFTNLVTRNRHVIPGK